MAKPTTSKLQASGTFKRVYLASLVPLKRKDPPITFVQAQIHSKEKGDRELTEREIAFFKKLKHEPGIVRMHTFCALKQNKYRVVFEKYDGSLDKLSRLTRTEKTDIARQVLDTMTRIHAKNIIHADLKLENVLYKKDADKQIHVGITDFGLSFEMEPRKKTAQQDHTFWDGSYGTAFATPPELIANKNFTGDLKKVDVWATGMLLYELILEKPPSWFDKVNLDPDQKLTPKIRQEVVPLIERDIEAPLKVLLAKKNPSSDDKLKILVFNMLRLNPDNRITMDEALQVIRKLY